MIYVNKQIVYELYLRKQNPTWDDFVKLEAQLANEREYEDHRQFSFQDFVETFTFSAYDFNESRKDISEAMLRIVERITPRQLEYPYSKSNLMETAHFDQKYYIEQSGDGGPYWIHHPSTHNVNAAKTLRSIIEKIGDILPDESAILVEMLQAEHHELRIEGYRALFKTTKHKWRYDQVVLTTAIQSMLSEDPAKRKQGYVKDSERKIPLAIVSADPSYLFCKNLENDEYIIYRGADLRIENILVECAQETDPEIRRKAFFTIGEYLERHLITHPLLDDILIKGAERRDDDAFFAINRRLPHGPIKNPKLLPLLMRRGDDSVWQNRVNAFLALSICVEKEKINSPEIKLLAKKHFNDENNIVRVSATSLFCILLSQEVKPSLDDSDINTLISMASLDSEKDARCNAVYALSIVTTKDLARIPQSDRSMVHGLCIKFRDYEGASKEERAVMSQAVTILNSVAEGRREKVISNIGNPALAEEVGELFDLDRIIINELEQKVANLKQSLTITKEKIELLTKKTSLQEQDLRDKEQLIKELRSKLKDSVEQLKKFKSNTAKKQGARMILTCLGLFVPQLKLLELSADVIQTVDSISNIVDVADVVQAIPGLV